VEVEKGREVRELLYTIDEVKEGRFNKKCYNWFCIKGFLESVIGTNKWRDNYCCERLKDFVMVSDEALAVTIYDNYFESWLFCYTNEKGTKNHMKAKWTNGGKRLKNGQSHKFCGGSKEGMEK